VKECLSCDHPCEESAPPCPEPKAEPGGDQTTAELDTKTGASVAQSVGTQSSARSNRFPAEYWMLFGVVLSASGYSYTVAAVIILYLLLKRFRPHADWELLMLASGFTGINFIKSFQLLSAHQTPIHFLEPFLVTDVAITLLCSSQRGWARVLLVYSLFGMMIEPIWVLFYAPNSFRMRDAVFVEILLAAAVWLITHWMARKMVVSATARGTSIFVLRRT
jgi:hypothetical protein